MRHNLLSGPIAAGARRMLQASATAGLIALSRRPLRLLSRFLCTGPGAVNLGHGRSDCRPRPEGGSVRTQRAEPPRIANCPMSHMDAGGNEWNNAPACVLGTV